MGEAGTETGIDYTDAMLDKAQKNVAKLDFSNVCFVKGDIEEMPLNENSFDVVVSNCVLNLVPDKNKAFSEIMRVLKPKGHFCVSDVVIKGTLPDKIRKDAEMYAGCVSGAIDLNEYIGIIEKQGFENVTIHKQKEVVIPDEVLLNYLSKHEIGQLKKSETGIYSITVSGYKQLNQ